MPPRKIYKRKDGQRAVKSLIELYPTRDDLLRALTRQVALSPGTSKFPRNQKEVLESFNSAALAGEWGEDYDVPDETRLEIESLVDRLFPALREPPQ